MRLALDPGPELDRLVHEMLGAPRPPGSTIPPYSTVPVAIGPVIEFLTTRTRYLGLIHTYDGLWIAMDADAVGDLADLDGDIEDEPGTVKVTGESLSHAACLLAVSLVDELRVIPKAA